MAGRSTLYVPKLIIIFLFVVGIPLFFIYRAYQDGTGLGKAIALAMIPVVIGLSVFTVRILTRIQENFAELEKSEDVTEMLEIIINKKESMVIILSILASFWIVFVIAYQVIENTP